MKKDIQNICETDSQIHLDENAACAGCGKFGAFHFGERTLCADCYEGCGSCCPEFGKDDLWPEALADRVGETKRK